MLKIVINIDNAIVAKRMLICIHIDNAIVAKRLLRCIHTQILAKVTINKEMVIYINMHIVCMHDIHDFTIVIYIFTYFYRSWHQ